MQWTRLFNLLVAASSLAACNDTGAPGESGTLSVRFRAVTAPPPSTATQAAGVSAAPDAVAALSVEGSNGTLTITGAWLVVDEFKLERVEDACEEGEAGGEGDDDGCEEFEAPPAFVAVPLEGDDAGTVTQEPVPPGSYEELKFETKAPDDDSGLLAVIRAEFPDWPEEASLLVEGTFAPAEGGDPIPFRAYFDAEVKVELEFEAEPLVVAEGGDQAVTVFVNPAVWFAAGDGTVVDLTAFDFGTTGEVAKLEAKFEDGFIKIEVEQ